jgi:hypothetical protein
VALAAITTILTPLTTDAGEWLETRVGRSPRLHTHTQLGDTMIYFSFALLVGAFLLTFAHIRERRGRSVTRALHWLIAVVVNVASVATGVQVYRIGDSGATVTWGEQMA